MNNRNIIISGLHMELTEAIKAATEDKLEKLFQHEPRIDSVRVELKYNSHAATHHNEFVAQGHVHIPGETLVVTEKSDELYHSINSMVEKLERQLRRKSERRADARKHPHEIDIPAELPKTE